MNIDTRITVKTGPALMMGGGALMVVGTLLPWATLRTVFGSMSVYGIEGDGKFALAFAFVLVMGGWSQMRSERFLKWPAVIAVLSAAFMAIEIALVSYGLDEAGSSDLAHASIGVGLYLSAIGAGLGVLGAFRSRNDPPRV